MRLGGRGHPEIRATHAKTLEFSPDEEIGRGATCVVAVGCRPPLEARAFAGAVRLEITAGDHTVVVHALGNPLWVPGGTAIVRRSDVRLTDTIATDADLAAADLPRDLVAALADPATPVSLTVTAARSSAALVLLWAPASHDRLGIEAAAAALVVSEDGDTDRLLASRGLAAVRAGATDVRATLDGGGRVLVVSTDDVPGRSVVEQLGRADTTVEVTGLPGPLAVAAASASRAPLVVATGQDPARALRSTPADHRLVVRTPAAALDKLVRAAEQHRGATGVIVARTPYELHERPVRHHVGLALSGDVLCCFEPGVGSEGLDAAEARLARALLADGVPTRTVARAVAELTGRPRNDAYTAVLALTRTH